MKNKSLVVLTIVVLSLVPKVCKGQSPNLNTASSFALFTSAGAFTNNGTSILYGDIGTDAGVLTGFPPGVLESGQLYLESNPYLSTVASDLSLTYADLASRIPSAGVLAVTLGNGQVLTQGVYTTGAGAAATLNGVLTLDGQDDPNALFIIKIDGALSTNASSTIVLINGTSLCNVYWAITGAVSLGENSVFRGTIVSGGSIEMLEGSSLHGRGLTTAGEIILHTNRVNFLPITPGAIVGSASVCQGGVGVVYTVPPISDASSYQWTLPPGASITSGATTESITVSFSTIATSGAISVYGTNACGNGIVSSGFSVTVNPLPTTSLIFHY